jgi:chromosome segregation ATPase
MFRSLFKLALLLIGGILVYNYFFGTSTEKENSRKIFGEMRDVVVSVGSLVKEEKAKFDAGKYDTALDKLGGAYRAIRERAEYVDQKVLKRLDDLEQRKAQLEQELNSIEQKDEQNANTPAPKKGIKQDPKAAEQTAAKAADLQRRKEKLQKQLDSLLKDSERLLQEAEKQE